MERLILPATFVFLICQSLCIVVPPTQHQTITTKCAYFNPGECSPPECNQTVEYCGEADEGKRWHCYALWKNESGRVVTLMSGCWIDAEKCYDQMLCMSNDMSRTNENFCCCDGDLCNVRVHDSPSRHNGVIGSHTTERDSGRSLSAVGSENWWVVLRTMLLSLLPLIFIALVVILVFWLWRRRKLSRHTSQHLTNYAPPSNVVTSAPRHCLGPVNLLEVKARGRFGCVWKAQMTDGAIVAVKVFPACDRQSWQTECHLYSLPHFHTSPNILQFIGAEMNGTDCWLVTEYHERGSLYDYLKSDVLTADELLRIALSMCCGLAFLHSPTVGKPSIAHRDLKSRNVLIRSDLTACIADFGLALLLDQPPADVHAQVGTRRYMAPEVLDGSVDFSIEHFLKIDVYACALVLWELMSRCVTADGLPGDYRMPFESEVGLYPSLEDMQEIIVSQRKRPEIKPHWLKNEDLSMLCTTIEDCWDHDTEARLSAECVVARLSQLYHSPSSSDVSVSSCSAVGDVKEMISLVA